MPRAVRLQRSFVCVVVGHKYPAVPRAAADRAPCWTCQRCGFERYSRPRDFWDGAGHLSGQI